MTDNLSDHCELTNLPMKSSLLAPKSVRLPARFYVVNLTGVWLQPISGLQALLRRNACGSKVMGQVGQVGIAQATQRGCHDGIAPRGSPVTKFLHARQ